MHKPRDDSFKNIIYFTLFVFSEIPGPNRSRQPEGGSSGRRAEEEDYPDEDKDDDDKTEEGDQKNRVSERPNKWTNGGAQGNSVVGAREHHSKGKDDSQVLLTPSGRGEASRSGSSNQKNYFNKESLAMLIIVSVLARF